GIFAWTHGNGRDAPSAVNQPRPNGRLKPTQSRPSSRLYELLPWYWRKTADQATIAGLQRWYHGRPDRSNTAAACPNVEAGRCHPAPWEGASALAASLLCAPPGDDLVGA